MLDARSHTVTALQQALDELGKEGWELIDKEWKGWWIFKRPYDRDHKSEIPASAVIR